MRTRFFTPLNFHSTERESEKFHTVPKVEIVSISTYYYKGVEKEFTMDFFEFFSFSCLYRMKRHRCEKPCANPVTNVSRSKYGGKEVIFNKIMYLANYGIDFYVFVMSGNCRAVYYRYHTETHGFLGKCVTEAKILLKILPDIRCI